MREECCKDCEFYESGFCNRFPESLKINFSLSHWCGEWKEKENERKNDRAYDG